MSFLAVFFLSYTLSSVRKKGTEKLEGVIKGYEIGLRTSGFLKNVIVIAQNASYVSIHAHSLFVLSTKFKRQF